MANNASPSSVKKGMNRSSHPSSMGKEEYTFALNSNTDDEYGNGRLNHTNEPSNLKCSGFKEGFKVVGFKFDRRSDQIYFFLTNPTTNCSEIGYIDVLDNIDSIDPIVDQCRCNIRVVLEDGLENVIQEATCEYKMLITDYCEATATCTQCLNFNINYPIKESNIQIKNEKTGKVLYWTDNYNPQRYLRLDYLSLYTQDIDECSGEVTEVCLKCEELKIFKEYSKPCLRPRIIQNGGNLRAGTVEVLIAASTIDGYALSNYLTITNPIHIHDKNNNILDQTNLDYQTSQAVAVTVEDFDEHFDFFKIVVVYRSGLDSAVTYYEFGVYPFDTGEVVIDTLTDKKRTTLSEITERRPYYTKAKGITSGNGYLIQYGLESIREINLQRVVNLMGAFAKWCTYQADENLYEDGVYISNYLSTMRGEVYPYSIGFVMDGGHELPLTPLIARPPLPSEIEELDAPGSTFVSNMNTESINDNTSTCSELGRNKRWQFEDTSTIDEEECALPTGAGEIVTEIRDVTTSCVVSELDGTPTTVDSILASSFIVETGVSLVDYINQHLEEIKNSTGPNGSDIRDILNTVYAQDCTPSFGDNCEDEELISEENFAISVETESVEKIYFDFEDYTTRVLPPQTCNTYQTDSSGNVLNDTAFVGSYMNPSEFVAKRFSFMTNASCVQSQQLPQLFSPQVDNFNYFKYIGEVGGITTLQGTIDISATMFSGVTTFSGTSGSANIILNATPYLLTFNTDINTTLNDFVTTNAATILTAFGLTVTVTGDTLVFEGDYPGFTDTPVTNVSGDLIGTYDNYSFTDKLHNNALWYKADFNSQERISAELSAILCATSDNNTYNSVRMSVYTSCSDTADLAIYTRIIDDMSLIVDPDKWVDFDSADFGGTSGSVYVVLDTVIRHRVLDSLVDVATLTTTCGCFSFFKRESEYYDQINYTNLEFGKRQFWKASCSFSILKLDGCGPVPHKTGKFSYVESIIKYPCNDQLYDSSNLVIPVDSIPTEIQPDFETYFTTGVSGSNYLLNPSTTNFMDQGIRHYKFPDNSKVPFMSEYDENPGDFKPSIIYPMGFFLSNAVINAFLDIAVINGLLTADERAKITKYNIYRGDRSVDKSIVAKGLLFDVYKYNEQTNSGIPAYYSNYPFNTLGTDFKNGSVPHPYSSLKNTKFVMHSPDTSFYKPTLAREILLEGYQFGKASKYFDEVMDHGTWIILGKKSYQLATGLAIAETVFELLLQFADYMQTGITAGTVYGAAAGIIYAVVMGIIITLQGMFKAGEYRYRWLQTITNFGHPYNFGYYSSAYGFYNHFLPNSKPNSLLRGANHITYIKEGNHYIPDETTGQFFNLNNFQREDGVFFNLGEDYPVEYDTALYTDYDNESTNESNSSRSLKWNGTGRSGGQTCNVASIYATIKQYLPSQYGQISSVKWVNTSYCGDLMSDNTCSPAFGGDTFISRFSLKRKFPFFTSTAHGLPPLTPFKYSDYFNIDNGSNSGRHYIDYLLDGDESFSVLSYVFPSPKSDYDQAYLMLDDNQFYIKPPVKIYLYSYGIPYFLCESEINSNFRYAKREAHENFYPNERDIIKFTQESIVSIDEPNTYFYNPVYSTRYPIYPWRVLPTNFKEEFYINVNNLENVVIYSGQDNSETSTNDPWLYYRALDYHQFPTSNGKLISMDFIESEQILSRFEHGFVISGAIDVLKDRIAPETSTLGTGGMFQGRTLNFNDTELGYAGTQHTALVNCEFGRFWCDAKRGEVFMLGPNAKGFENISGDLDKWFKEQLPFKMPNYIPEVDIDNAYNGVGIVMGWDARLKRVFITKKDYIPNRKICYSNFKFYLADGYEGVIAEFEDSGFTYQGTSGCNLLFQLEDNTTVYPMTEVSLTDAEYFEDVSWTVAYKPLDKAWVSYYSFCPNYYIGLNNHFKTGINDSGDDTEFGLWSHYSFISSYQVFYGKKYPWIVEFPKQAEFRNGTLEYVKYWMDVRKYYNRYDFSDVYGIGFNKAWIYNPQQNTGQLNLVHHSNNNIQQLLLYPKHNTDSIDILQTEISGEWSFNYLYNAIRNERAGVPVWNNTRNNVEQTINLQTLDYRNNFKDRLKGDYFLIRLQQDLDTRFKMVMQLAISYENK